MEEIGRKLKERREVLGLTLEQVERSIHIRANRLEALEAGAFDALPSRVQLRGFLRNYAGFLGLEADELLDLHDRSEREGVSPHSGQRAKTRSSLDVPSNRVLRGRSLLEFIISGGVVAAVAAVFLWGLWSIVTTLNAQTISDPTPLDTSVSDQSATPAATPSPAPQFTQEGVSVTSVPAAGTAATPTLILPVFDSVRLELRATSETWVRLSVDGEQVFQGRMNPGDRLEYNAEEMIELLTGNAGGLRVVFNGQDQGPLGDIAQVVERVWSPRGIVTPTSTTTYTPTASPEVSLTPTPPATATSLSVP